MKRELRRIVEYQHWRLRRGGKSFPRAEEMTGKNLFFIDASVGQKPIGRFRTRPFLTGKGDAASKWIPASTNP